MLIFLDETFREKVKENGEKVKFGALCGVAIPLCSYSKVANEVYKLKLHTYGREYADSKEIKGKKILNQRTFDLAQKNPEVKQRNIEFVKSLISILKRHKVTVLGCVCFDQEKIGFTCTDEKYLDCTYKSICERINMFMKREFPNQKAIVIFDNRDAATDEHNAKAMTNFLVRSNKGISMRSSILEIPMFAISQAHNVGLQLADIVTTIIGLHAEERQGSEELYKLLHERFYTWRDNYGRSMSTLRWIDKHRLSRQKK